MCTAAVVVLLPAPIFLAGESGLLAVLEGRVAVVGGVELLFNGELWDGVCGARATPAPVPVPAPVFIPMEILGAVSALAVGLLLFDGTSGGFPLLLLPFMLPLLLLPLLLLLLPLPPLPLLLPPLPPFPTP